MTPAELFASCRVDFTAELADTVRLLADARPALTATELAYREADNTVTALCEFVTSAFPPGSTIAAPLHARIQDGRDILKAPAAARGAARAAVAQLEARISELHDALIQIDAAIAASKTGHVRQPVETVRRKPAIVDFDNIQFKQIAP
jgi:hypothetical protein